MRIVILVLLLGTAFLVLGAIANIAKGLLGGIAITIIVVYALVKAHDGMREKKLNQK